MIEGCKFMNFPALFSLWPGNNAFEEIICKYAIISKMGNQGPAISNVGYQGWNSLNACQNSKQGRP